MFISPETLLGRVFFPVIFTFIQSTLTLHFVKKTFNLVDIFGSVVVEKEQLGNPANLIFDLRSQFVPDLELIRFYMTVDRLIITDGCTHSEYYLTTIQLSCDNTII